MPFDENRPISVTLTPSDWLILLQMSFLFRSLLVPSDEVAQQKAHNQDELLRSIMTQVDRGGEMNGYLERFISLPMDQIRAVLTQEGVPL